MELPNDVLEALKKGDRIVIRGDPGDDAVLCTGNRTYELKVAETSNALLLSPDLCLPSNSQFQSFADGSLAPSQVTACLGNYYELRLCQPKTQKLRELLSECPYRGPEYESEQIDMNSMQPLPESVQKKRKGPQKYTFEELKDRVQASDAELLGSLEQQQACNVDGFWRTFDPDYRDRVFQSILTLLEEEDWSYSKIPLEGCLSKLLQLEPSFAIEHCLKCYGTAFTDDLGEVFYKLSEAKVCQFYGELILRPAGKFNYHEFMKSWQDSVPEGMLTSLHQLEGVALTDMNATPPVIWFYPVTALPQDPTERFNRLFALREKWTQSDIEPYIRDLETSSQSLKALLLKHARMSTGPKGEKIYNAKRTPT